MFEIIGMITITVIIYVFLTIGLSMVFIQDYELAFMTGWFFGMCLFVLAACLWITGTPFPVT